jgi:hypothetical protein
MEIDTAALRLKHLAGLAGVSMRELDRIARRKEKLLQHIIQRGGTCHPKTAEDYGRAFGIEPAWILYGSGDAPTPENVRAAVARAQAELAAEAERSTHGRRTRVRSRAARSPKARAASAA